MRRVHTDTKRALHFFFCLFVSRSQGCFKSNGSSTVRAVGKFKGLISISESRSPEPLVPLERVADYLCRLYVWKVWVGRGREVGCAEHPRLPAACLFLGRDGG